MPGINGVYPGGDGTDITSLAGGDRTARKGVFAQYPATTPKYHTGNTYPSLEYMARLFIPLPSPAAHKAFLATVLDKNAIALAKALATTGRSENFGAGCIDFLLQQVQESYQEKYEAVDVLSDNYVSYFYGQQPPLFQYAGTLLNSRQDDWRAAFTVMYQEILRGTKMARRKVVATLAYDDVMVTGVLVNMSQTLTADMELAAPFVFQLLVKRYDVYTQSGGPLTCPTILGDYPYKITPGEFVSPIVSPTSVSMYVAQNAIFSTTKTRVASPVASGSTQDFSDGVVPTDTTPKPTYNSPPVTPTP